MLQVVACEVRGDCEKQLPKNKVSISSSAL